MSAAMSSGAVCPGGRDDSMSKMRAGAEMLCTRARKLLQGVVWSGICAACVGQALQCLPNLVSDIVEAWGRLDAVSC